MVLKELIFNSFYFGGGCDSHERTDLVTVSNYGEGVVVLKEHDF